MVVAISIICLGLEDSLENPNANLMQEINMADYITASIFIAEFIIKIIVYGLVMGPKTYMRDGWNVLDFVIIIISIVGFIVDNNANIGNGSNASKYISLLKMLRVLRTLRMISRNECLKISM